MKGRERRQSLAERPLGRRIHAAAGDLGDVDSFVAAHVRAVRIIRCGWAIVFYFSFRNKPATTRAADVSEFRVPWQKLISSRTVWLLWIQYFCLTYGWFFYVTWLPTYLKETRGLALDQNAFMLWLGNALKQLLRPDTTQQVLIAAMAGIPLFFGGFGAIVCGLVTPHLLGERAVRANPTDDRILRFSGRGGLYWSPRFT